MAKVRTDRKSDVLAYSAALEVITSLDDAARLILYFIFHPNASVKSKREEYAKALAAAYFKQAARCSRSKK